MIREKKTYLSTYCNKHHDLETGKPLDHECRTIPPEALLAERMDAPSIAINIMSRCGDCPNCGQLKKVQKSVMACCNPPFSHASQDVVDLWNSELERLPCTKCPRCGSTRPGDTDGDGDCFVCAKKEVRDDR